MPWIPIQTPSRDAPHGRRCYTRAEAVAAVGPGWATLAGRAWDVATKAGCIVVQVKEKFGTLTVYARPRPNEVVAFEAVLDALGAIAASSATVCEWCGAPGARYDGEAAVPPQPPADRSPSRRSAWIKTLCPGCADRFYVRGERRW